MLDLIITLALFLVLYILLFSMAGIMLVVSLSEKQLERTIDHLAWWWVDCEFLWHDICIRLRDVFDAWFPPGRPIIVIVIRRLPRD